MSGWIGYVTVVCVIVLIWPTLRIHAEAEQRRRNRQKPSPDDGAPENIRYMFSGNDLWGRLLGGDHSAHHHSSHSTEVTAPEALTVAAAPTAGAGATAAAAFDDSHQRNQCLDRA